MLIISNNIKEKMTLPEDTVIRVNLAWIKNKDEARKILESNKCVYLDYPKGRSKPPKPSLTLQDALDLAKLPTVKYFAVSNVEDVSIAEIKKQLPEGVELIPKIETKIGVINFKQIVESIDGKYVMLDKEDLYSDVNHDSEKYQILIDLAREEAKKLNVHLLELQGVIFS